MEALGIDIKLILAQTINFLILVFILRALVYKPLLKMLSKRKEEIEKGLKLTSEMEANKQKFEKEKEKVRQELQEEGKRIIEQAMKEAREKEDKIAKEIRTATQEEKQKVLEELKQEKKKIIEEAKQQSIDYALLISEKILKNKLTEEEQKELVAEAVVSVNKALVN